MPCKRSSKSSPGARDLSCHRITFIPPDLAPQLIVKTDLQVAASSKVLLPLLTVRAPFYDKALNWFQFYFTGDRKGAYVDLDSTVIDWISLFEGDPLFAPDLWTLPQNFPGSYGPLTTSTFVPFVPDYIGLVLHIYVHTGWAPKRREDNPGVEHINIPTSQAPK